jgi:LysM repeat protein
MSVNGVSHIGYGGTRPYQRALNAGYPLAGDLSLGGFMSENITAGKDKSVQQAVLEWQGDAPHLNTMLSPNLTEIGAGVAIVSGYVYYVIDCAQPTSSGAVSYTPQPTSSSGGTGTTPKPGGAVAPLVSTIIPNTPDAEGKLYHTVKPGETLWLIAITYGVKIADIRRLNGLAENQEIFPGTKLLILKMPTPTPMNTVTVTLPPTRTPFATWTPSPTITSITPTPQKTAAASPSSSMTVLGVIVLAALVLSGVMAVSLRVRR